VPSSHATFIAILKSSQRQHLSEYEWQEILDYPSVYYIGAGSEKKPGHPDKPANNYGYDDDRGDYLVVDHDHLGYRYEVTDSLGKGSFGQVLSCRDHATGGSVAIKIIRNKKRFHHQALVEIKILDNLRQWVRYLLFIHIQSWLTYLSGSRGKTSRYQDDGALLLSQSPLHCHGTTEY
jgi:dual specificity tyrosine-phosphorylation-regulated kinase 2/3/4